MQNEKDLCMAVLFLVSVTSLLEQVVQADPEDIPVKPCRRRNGLETEWNSAAANSGDRICRVIQMAEV
jgi:hypothetical protein